MGIISFSLIVFVLETQTSFLLCFVHACSFSSSIITFPPKFVNATPWKQARSTWHFNAPCSMASIRARAFLLEHQIRVKIKIQLFILLADQLPERRCEARLKHCSETVCTLNQMTHGNGHVYPT